MVFSWLVSYFRVDGCCCYLCWTEILHSECFFCLDDRRKTNWEMGNKEIKTWVSSSFIQGKAYLLFPCFPWIMELDNTVWNTSAPCCSNQQVCNSIKSVESCLLQHKTPKFFVDLKFLKTSSKFSRILLRKKRRKFIVFPVIYYCF